MIARVTLTPSELMTLAADHLRAKFKGMMNHEPTEFLDVLFPVPPAPLEATLEAKRKPLGEDR